MARARMLSKTLGSSRRFNQIYQRSPGLADFAQLFFTMLIPHADDFGRMTGDPLSLKLQVLPGSPRPLSDFEDALELLHDVCLVHIYESEDDIWLQINKFDEHQPGLTKRTESRIPGISRKSVNFTEIREKYFSRARAEENRTELNRTELKGTEPNRISDPNNKLERERSVSSTSGKKVNGASLSSASRDAFTDPKITERAGRLVERYAELFPKYRKGARYVVKPARDYDAAVHLCQTWEDDERLEKLAICFLTTNHKFAEEGSRTLGQFLALASWVDGELAAWEAKNAPRTSKT